MAGCPAFEPYGPFVTGLAGLVDCHATALGRDGYMALSAAGSPVAVALTSLLTLFVAVLGWRMLLGETPQVGSLTAAAARIGFVVALCTAWPAYQVLVYDVAVRAPGELAARVLSTSGLGEVSRPALAERLQRVYDALAAATPPPPPAAPAPAALTASPQGPPTAAVTTPPQPPGRNLPTFNEVAVRAAAQGLLVTSLGGLVAPRLASGLLLALGPLFVACFLFETTRGLFIGWLRALAAAALGALATACVLALELAVLEPQARALAAAETLDQAQSLPGEMLAAVGVFAIVCLAALGACVMAASGLRMTPSRRREALFRSDAPPQNSAPSRALAPPPVTAAGSPPSRAAALAHVIETQQRRESSGAASAVRRLEIAPARASPTLPTPMAFGQAHRRAAPRASAAAARRDGQS